MPEQQVNKTSRHTIVHRNLPQLPSDNAKAKSNPSTASREIDGSNGQRPLSSLHVSAAGGIEKGLHFNLA